MDAALISKSLLDSAEKLCPATLTPPPWEVELRPGHSHKTNIFILKIFFSGIRSGFPLRKLRGQKKLLPELLKILLIHELDAANRNIFQSSLPNCLINSLSRYTGCQGEFCYAQEIFRLNHRHESLPYVYFFSFAKSIALSLHSPSPFSLASFCKPRNKS